MRFPNSSYHLIFFLQWALICQLIYKPHGRSSSHVKHDCKERKKIPRTMHEHVNCFLSSKVSSLSFLSNFWLYIERGDEPQNMHFWGLQARSLKEADLSSQPAAPSLCSPDRRQSLPWTSSLQACLLGLSSCPSWLSSPSSLHLGALGFATTSAAGSWRTSPPAWRGSGRTTPGSETSMWVE